MVCHSSAPMGGIKLLGHPGWADVKPGACYRLDSGLVSQPVAPFRKCLDNVLAGLKERVLFLDEAGTVPPPATEAMRSAENIVTGLLMQWTYPPR